MPVFQVISEVMKMCLAKLYESPGSDRATLEDIARIRFGPDGIELKTLYGETKVISGKISQIDFVKSTVVLAD